MGVDEGGAGRGVAPRLCRQRLVGPLRELLGIARAAGADRLAQTIEGYGKRLKLDKAGKAGVNKQVIGGAALYGALRRAAGLDDRTIRSALREYGFQEIADPARLTGLTADIEADRRAALAAATRITPRTASETMPAVARLGLRPLGPGGGVSGGSAEPAPREIWQLDRKAFLESARTVGSAANGTPVELLFEGLAGEPSLAYVDKNFVKRWSFDHPRFPVTVDPKDAGGWDAAAGAVHYHQVKEALQRGDFVPDRVLADYDDLRAAWPARLVDDPRLARRPAGLPAPRAAGPMVARMGARRLGGGARYALGPDTEAAQAQRRSQAAGFAPGVLAARGFDLAGPGWTAVADPHRPSIEPGGTTVLDHESSARRLIGDDIAPVYVASARPADLTRPAADPVLDGALAGFWRENEDLLRAYAAATAAHGKARTERGEIETEASRRGIDLQPRRRGRERGRGEER